MPQNGEQVRQMIRTRGPGAKARPIGRHSSHDVRSALVEREYADIADVADQMREDYQVAFVEEILAAHIKSAKVTISNKGDEGGERANLLADQLMSLWQETLPRMVEAIGNGRVAFEKVFDFNDQSMISFVRKLDALPFRNTKMLLDDDGSFLGVKLEAKGKEEVIPADYAWWLAIDETAVEPHGRSRYVGAPLEEYRDRVETRKVRKILIRKFCLRGGTARMPGSDEIEDGTVEDAANAMQDAIDKLQAGGLLILPNDRDGDGNPLYDFVETEKLMDPAPVDNAIRESDIRMLRAFGISELAVSQTSDVGSFAMAAVHRMVLMSVVEGILSQFATSFQKYVIDKVVDLNFDEDDRPLIEITWPTLTDVPGDLLVKVAENILMSPSLSPLVLTGVVDIVQLFDAVGVPVSDDVEERIIAALKLAREQAEQEKQQGPPGQANFANVNLAAQRAPKGGVTIAGKDYKGGMFIPADEMAQASDEELQAFREAQQAEEGGASGGQPSQRQSRVKKKAPSEKTKSEIAKASAKRTAVEVQRYGEEVNESVLADGLGETAIKEDDNKPEDVEFRDSKGRLHGIELKTMVTGERQKITMKRSAMDRKEAWEQGLEDPGRAKAFGPRKEKATFHTVVFDDREVVPGNSVEEKTASLARFLETGDDTGFDFNKRKILYRRGFGSIRTDGMQQVKDFDELRRVMEMPNSRLPREGRRKERRRR